MIKNLVWYGPVFSYSGYAVHNRSMIFELAKRGWNIKVIPTEEHIPEHLIGKDLLIRLTKNTSVDPENSICINLIPPPALPMYGVYTILFTTIESKTVHEGFFRRCTLFDEVWVPCKTNVQSMLAAGWPRKKLFHVQEGVYPGFWNDQPDLYEKYKSNYFTFFYNGDWSFRKGVDTLLVAYAKAFLPTDPVRLLLLTHWQGNSGEKSRLRIFDEYRQLYNQVGITRYPRLEFIFDHVPDPLMPAIYKSSDVYVSPTRGEAWALPIIQAMSCGIPGIVPDWGGHRDYCTNENSYLIKTRKFDTIHDKVNLEVDFYRYQLFCFPDIQHLTELMRYAYQHRQETKRKGALARKWVKKYFDWSIAGKIADERLTQIYETEYRKRLHKNRRLCPSGL